MDILSIEELLLLNYLLSENQDNETVSVSDQFQSELKVMSSVERGSNGQSDDYAKAADLTMLIVKSRAFASWNTRTALAAGCIMLVLNEYTLSVDRDELSGAAARIDTGTWTRNKLTEWFQKVAE